MNKAQRKALQVPINKLVAAVGDIEDFLASHIALAPVTREKRLILHMIANARDAADGAINQLCALIEEYGGEVR